MSADARQHPADAEAAAWITRLSGGEASEAEGLAFDAWLSASPAHAAAYRRALADWQDYERYAEDVLAELDSPRHRPLSRHEPLARPGMRPWSPMRRGVAAAAGLALAAGFAVVVVAPALRQPAPQVQVYQTARAEHRTVTLADGSKIEMDAETRLSVALGKDRRQVAFEGGQAIFDVVHDPARPFAVTAAGHEVRDVGTQFEIRERGHGLTVTVAHGEVEVRPSAAGAGRVWRLAPGERLAIEPGGVEIMKTVDPGETFAWRTGRLVYREQPLGEVVADLNREFTPQLRIGDPSLARIPITGVIVLDNPHAVATRLALMLPVKTVPSAQGLTLLRK